MEEVPFKAPCMPRDYAIPKAIERERGNVPSLETLGCFRDDVPKIQLRRIYLEILIGMKSWRRWLRARDLPSGQSLASACPGIFMK